MKTYLIYQAYGKKSNLDQTLYSVLSAIPFIEKEQLKIEIVLYTDQKPFFEKYLNGLRYVHFEPLTDDIKQNWLGKIKFIHRLKIEMLKDAAQKYQGNILYLDGDTYFTKSPQIIADRIQPTLSVMHICEDQLKPAQGLLTRKLFRFLKSTPIYVEGELQKFKTDCRMWNAGVIGVNSQMTWVFDKILKLTDELYTKYPKHIMEQFAVSYYLQKNSQVVGCDDVLEHYWMQKEEYPALISAYLDTVSNREEFFKNLSQFKLPDRIYKNPYATFRMRIYQKVPALRPTIRLLNKWIESPSIE